jgi:hypothetical protein
MKLNTTQIVIIVILAGLTAALYFLPKKVLAPKQDMAARDKGQQTANEEKLKDITLILNESISSLPADTIDALKKMEADASSGNEEDRLKKLDQLEKIFGKLNNKLGVAWCTEEKMKLTKNEEKIKTGLAYYDAYRQSTIDDNRKAIAAKVIEYLNPALEAGQGDPDILKCALGDCYVNTTSPPMKGVNMLKDVIAKDSTNEQALQLLAEFSLKSGQTEKAIERYKTLVRHYPAKTKYSLYLAQLFSDL